MLVSILLVISYVSAAVVLAAIAWLQAATLREHRMIPDGKVVSGA